MSVVDELTVVAGKVASLVGPAVVRVGGWRGGAGFVVEQGHVLTNAHNVGGEPVPLMFADGRQADGVVAGIDVDGDLAVLAVDTVDISAPEWAAEQPALGAVVFVIGPAGSGQRLTMGTLSSTAQAFRGPRGRPIAGGLEHTAPLARGASGSPLIDSSGRIVGINTNRLGGGFYVALPTDDELRRRVDQLVRGTSIERPRLGVGVAPGAAARRLRRAVGLPEQDGVLVREVEEGGPAQTAGIRQGDLLVEANGRTLRHVDDLYTALAGVSMGGSLALRVVRGTDEREVTVSFAVSAADRPAE